MLLLRVVPARPDGCGEGPELVQGVLQHCKLARRWEAKQELEGMLEKAAAAESRRRAQQDYMQGRKLQHVADRWGSWAQEVCSVAAKGRMQEEAQRWAARKECSAAQQQMHREAEMEALAQAKRRRRRQQLASQWEECSAEVQAHGGVAKSARGKLYNLAGETAREYGITMLEAVAPLAPGDGQVRHVGAYRARCGRPAKQRIQVVPRARERARPLTNDC